MTFNFEKWPGKEKAVVSNGFSTYVTFSRSQMYVSTKLMKKEGTEDGRFDILVDKEKRTFALKFSKEGGFRLPSIPGQVSAGAFIGEFKPKTGERLQMKKDKESGLWVGHLDGGKVDMAQVESPEESEDGKSN